MTLVSAPTSLVAEERANDSGIGDVSQGRLMVRRFKQSKLAVISLVILVIMALGALFAPFFSTNDPQALDNDYQYAAPSSWTWNGGPALCKKTQYFDPVTIGNKYRTDCKNSVGVSFFGKGFKYKLLGVIPTTRHFMVSKDPGTKLLPWGGDMSGRDVYSRSVYGARISMSVGVLTAIVVMILGGLIGTASGYVGGAVDTLIQRVIEVVQSVPQLPLWATLTTVMPSDWPVTKRFFILSMLLAAVGWPGLARAIRGKVLTYNRADYVSAAKAAGSGGFRIVRTHLMPNAMSHLVASGMLVIPGTILAETTLSFLGLGMQPPGISWGVLLKDATDLGTLTLRPWLLLPGALVVVCVACFQFLGDGVRDAVDPYG